MLLIKPQGYSTSPRRYSGGWLFSSKYGIFNQLPCLSGRCMGDPEASTMASHPLGRIPPPRLVNLCNCRREQLGVLLLPHGAFGICPTMKIHQEFQSSMPSSRRSSYARKMLCHPPVDSNSHSRREILDIFGQKQFI